MNNSFCLTDVHIVTPEEVLHHSEITVTEGVITCIGPNDTAQDIPRIDGQGQILLPGFIDIHCDALEKEIEPRPGSLLPFDIALVELDKKLAAAGITTMYHSLSFADTDIKLLRTMDTVDTIIHEIKRLSSILLVNTKVHARYEITNSKSLFTLDSLVHDGYIDLVSLMDHTPGQGQFRTLEQFSEYYGPRFTDDAERIEEVMQQLQKKRDKVGLTNAVALAEVCRECAIPLASHDDDCLEKIQFIKDFGARISEFPITMDAARKARESDLGVVVGSPNIVRGGSHNGNLNAEDIISRGYGSIVCSDYIPSTLLHAAFRLLEKGVADLPGIAALFSGNAAQALGTDHERGSLREGLWADMVLVDTTAEMPRCVSTWREGRRIFASCPA
ncbi:MAG: alpha-D-ribose 1-methylphosphonate 5-triphosphate diphosphatase [Fibrobacterota bacterium]